MKKEPTALIRISPNSLLILNKSGKLQRLFVPFIVICVAEIQEIKIGEKLEVTAVISTKRVAIVYIIQGRPYAHYFFVVNV